MVFKYTRKVEKKSNDKSDMKIKYFSVCVLRWLCACVEHIKIFDMVSRIALPCQYLKERPPVDRENNPITQHSIKGLRDAHIVNHMQTVLNSDYCRSGIILN